MSEKINIAIDGYSSCGKSTITKQLSERLGYTYIDTGAMYRAVTYFFLQQNVDFSNGKEVQQALDRINLSFVFNENHSRIMLNGKQMDEELRTMEVSNHVSDVAALSAVRSFLVTIQQKAATNKGVVMDGRDIGTVVLPNAELKLFMVADKDIRVQRRYDELLAKGKNVSREAVRKNLEQRDYIDSHREDSPLSKAEDAVLIDNSHLTIEQQLKYVLRLVDQKIQKQKKL